MTERGGGTLGPFLLGVAVGAALGALFAPDTGEVTRRQLGKKLRGLKDLAEDKADELKALVGGAGSAGDDGNEEFEDEGEDEDEDETAPRSARDELEQRLAEARRRRRQASRSRDSEQEDEPVA